MPFLEMPFEWAENMFVSDDTMAGMGAPAIHGGKRGFGGMLFLTVHLLQMMQDIDWQCLPDGFSVPAGTSMWVLLVYNAVDGLWQAADAAGPGHVKQHMLADNMVHTFFGHTFSGKYGAMTFSESSFAYVVSGGVHYFVLLSLLQNLPVLTGDGGIMPAADEHMANYAPSGNNNITPTQTEDMGGLDLFASDEDISCLELDTNFMLPLNAMYDPEGLNMWDGQEDEVAFVDDWMQDTNDMLSQATTPVFYKMPAQPVSCGADQDFFEKQLPDCFPFGLPVTSPMAPIHFSAELPVETLLGLQSLVHTEAVPLDKPVALCKRILQLDAPPAPPVLPASPAPPVSPATETLALPAPPGTQLPAKKSKTTNAPRAGKTGKQCAPRAKKTGKHRAPRATLAATLADFAANKQDAAVHEIVHGRLVELVDDWRVLLRKLVDKVGSD